MSSKSCSHISHFGDIVVYRSQYNKHLDREGRVLSFKLHDNNFIAAWPLHVAFESTDILLIIKYKQGIYKKTPSPDWKPLHSTNTGANKNPSQTQINHTLQWLKPQRLQCLKAKQNKSILYIYNLCTLWSEAQHIFLTNSERSVSLNAGR